MACFAISGAANAQSLSVANVYAMPGTTAAFGLTINVEGGAYKGFQFEMQFPQTGFNTASGNTASADWTNSSISTSNNLVNGAGKAAAFSTSNALIPDGEMLVGTVAFSVDSSVETGDYTVTISNFDFLDGTNYTHVDNVTFTIHVVEMPVLDENSTIAPAVIATATDLLVKRTINAGEWSTICFPFAMSADKLKAAFGDDYDLEEFTGYEAEKDADDKVVGLTLNFTKNTKAAKINTPYIIKTSKDITEFEVNAKVNPGSTTKPITIEDDETGEEVEVASMTGIYQAGTVVPENSLFLSGNKFWYSAGKTKMKGFRAYFTLNDVLAEAAQAGARIVLNIGDETTGVSQIVNSKSVNGKYNDLLGRSVQHPSKKGVYIRNGKKEVVK